MLSPLFERGAAATVEAPPPLFFPIQLSFGHVCCPQCNATRPRHWSVMGVRRRRDEPDQRSDSGTRLGHLSSVSRRRDPAGPPQARAWLAFERLQNVLMTLRDAGCLLHWCLSPDTAFTAI